MNVNGKEYQTEYARINPLDLNMLEISLLAENFEEIPEIKKFFDHPENLEIIEDGESRFTGYKNLKQVSVKSEDSTNRIYLLLRHETVEEEIRRLKESLRETEETANKLMECILELSEVVYS